MNSQITSYLLVIITITLIFNSKVTTRADKSAPTPGETSDSSDSSGSSESSDFISNGGDFMEQIESYLDSMIQPKYVVGYGYNSGPVYQHQGSGFEENYEQKELKNVKNQEDEDVKSVLKGLKQV